MKSSNNAIKTINLNPHEIIYNELSESLENIYYYNKIVNI